MAQVIVARTTAHPISETRLIRQVDQEMAELQPSLAPLYTFMTKMKGKSKPVKSPRIEWFEDDLVADWDSNGPTTEITANAASTTVTVVDGTKWATGDLGVVPNAVDSATVPEIFRVVSVTANVITVVRNVGSGTLATIATNDALMILGKAHEEYSAAMVPKVTIPSAKISYTQIFKENLAFSGTQLASDEYASGGSERKRQQDKKMRELKVAMNRDFMFGRASEALTGGPNGRPVRTTMGFNSVVTTNVYDSVKILTKKGFEAFARMSFRYNQRDGSSELLLLAAPLIISAIHDWGNSFLQLKPMENMLGVDITRVRTGHGTWALANDVVLQDGVSGKNGFGGWAFSINMDNVNQRVLKNRPLTMTTNVIRDGADGETDEILGELGLCIKLEKTHAKLYNVEDYQE